MPSSRAVCCELRLRNRLEENPWCQPLGMLNFHTKFYRFLVDLAGPRDGPTAGHAFLYANQWLEVVCLPGFKAGVDGVEHGDLVKAGG